jgi:cell wall-associated NlpC family hydrolase
VKLHRGYPLRSLAGASDQASDPIARKTAGPPGRAARAPRRAGVYRLVGVVAVACALTSVTALPAAADPVPAASAPATADEAKQAWLDAVGRAQPHQDQVAAAQAAVDAARARSDAAAADLAAAVDRTAAEQQKVAAADAAVAQYQARMADLADASFGGARFSPVASFLTSGTGGFLGDAAAEPAADSPETLSGALTARQDADAARAAAQLVENQARAAKQAADQATADAQAARDGLDAQKAQLDADIATYQLAFAQLSAADLDAPVADPQASVAFASKAPSVQAAIAVEAALSRQGLDYVWGAVGPDTFDCSGLMLWAWAKAGVEIPRNSAAQAAALPEVPLDQLQPGDLVTYYSPVTHVGMYVGDGKVLHASQPGTPIKVVDLADAGPAATGHAVNR